ncbi:glycosyltransferase [Streptomyces cyaneofuscatus]|uniref:glycosyltransferase n=1 Tax=Streptomyces cyaneofuscatus TaxID=66883 RepID=UPI0033D5AEBC
MKVLFIGGVAPAHIFGIVPLAHALRSAGHQVFIATTEKMAPVITGCGIAALPVAEHDIWYYISTGRDGRPVPVPEDPRELLAFVGGWFAHLAAESYASLVDVTRDWRPDLVVGGTMGYAAPLLAARLGIPHVMQAWDPGDWRGTDEGAHRVLDPELRELGIRRLPEAELRIEICPPSIAPPDAPPAELMRWTPGNLQCALEPWMYTRPERPRICLTAGSRASTERSFAGLRELTEQLAPLDAELVVPAPEALAAELRAALPQVRTGWIPLDVVAPTCDLVMHHAGGATAMNALHAGVPQLIVPESPAFAPPARRIAGFGAAIALDPEDATGDAVRQAAKELLTDPRYRERSDLLAREIARLPPPAAFVGRLERLVTG